MAISFKAKFRQLFVFMFDLVLFIFFLPINFYSLKNKKSISETRKILLLELWGIGDLVLTTPVFRLLRNRFPKAKITLLAKVNAVDLFTNDCRIDQIITFNFPWTKHSGKYRFWNWDIVGLLKIIIKLRKERFDIALDARMDIRNNLLMWLIGAKRRLGYNVQGGGCFLTDIALFDEKNQHRINVWMGLLNCLDIETENLNPELYIVESEERFARKFLHNNRLSEDDLIIGIHPGAGIKKRCWPLERFEKVAQYVKSAYNAKIIIFVEPGGYGDKIINGSFIRANLSLKELVSVVSKINLFICNDSGPMHIATAVGTSVVAIFGPGNLNIIGPYGKKHHVVIKGGFSCRPCRDYCKYEKSYCLLSIQVEDVTKVIDKIMGNRLAGINS